MSWLSLDKRHKSLGKEVSVRLLPKQSMLVLCNLLVSNIDYKTRTQSPWRHTHVSEEPVVKLSVVVAALDVAILAVPDSVQLLANPKWEKRWSTNFLDSLLVWLTTQQAIICPVVMLSSECLSPPDNQMWLSFTFSKRAFLSWIKKKSISSFQSSHIILPSFSASVALV